MEGSSVQMLYEKYRPKSLDSVLGQDNAVDRVKRLLHRAWGSRAWWIAGASGTGKTTIARIIANHGADEAYVTEYDSADMMSITELKWIEERMGYFAPGKGGRAYIINEAHELRRPVIGRLLGLLERIPHHVCFVFTTTKTDEENLFEGQIDARPLLSRCARIELEGQGLASVFAAHCKKIAEAEGLDKKPLQAYLELAQRCGSNCREMLLAIEAGEMLS